MASVWLAVLFGVVIVAGTVAGLRMRGTPDEPRRRDGWMQPIASVLWVLGGVMGVSVVMLPALALQSLVTTGDAWPEEYPSSLVLDAALVVMALVVVALFAAVFAQWWQPLYVFGGYSGVGWLASFDPSGETPWLDAWLDGIVWVAGIAALAATGILLRLLTHHLRRREGAATVGTLLRLYRDALRSRTHRRRVHPPTTG